MLKKILIGVGAVIAALVVVGVGGGLLMDSGMVLNTEQRLKAAPAQVFPMLTSVSGLRAWWDVALKDEATKLVVKKKDGGPNEGVGLVVTFESPGGDVFETWTLREATAPSRVVYDVDFAGMMTTKRTITLTPGSFGGCDAHWGEIAEIKNPVFRWMKMMISLDEAAEDRNAALRALDTAAASESAAPAAATPPTSAG